MGMSLGYGPAAAKQEIALIRAAFERPERLEQLTGR
jgi:hypothetical protein